VESQGLYEFMQSADLMIGDLAKSFRMPDLNMESFTLEYFEDATPKEKEPTVWDPPATYDEDAGDGIPELTGYNLGSFWKDIKNENSEIHQYWIDLPENPGSLRNEGKNITPWSKYSRTNLEEIRRVIKTYMRQGDFFLENCCGWSTFSCSAAYHGYSGIGVDIWDVALDHSRRQYSAIPDPKGKYDLKACDGMALSFQDQTFDFVYCNPPFMDTEKYSGSMNDICDSDFDSFATKFIRLMSENFRVLKDDCLCVITINDKREKGYLVPLQKYVIEWAEKVGFKLWDFALGEVISQGLRFRKKNYELRRTVKCHEYIIVFKRPLSSQRGITTGE